MNLTKRESEVAAVALGWLWQSIKDPTTTLIQQNDIKATKLLSETQALLLRIAAHQEYTPNPEDYLQ